MLNVIGYKLLVNFAYAKFLAEREGFEPPVEFPPQLLSRQPPSTGLGHLSEGGFAPTDNH